MSDLVVDINAEEESHAVESLGRTRVTSSKQTSLCQSWAR